MKNKKANGTVMGLLVFILTISTQAMAQMRDIEVRTFDGGNPFAEDRYFSENVHGTEFGQKLDKAALELYLSHIHISKETRSWREAPWAPFVQVVSKSWNYAKTKQQRYGTGFVVAKFKDEKEQGVFVLTDYHVITDDFYSEQ